MQQIQKQMTGMDNHPFDDFIIEDAYEEYEDKDT